MSILFSLDIHHHHHDTCIYIYIIYIYELFIYSPSCLSYKMGGFVPLVLTLFPLKFEGGYIYICTYYHYSSYYIYIEIYIHIYIYMLYFHPARPIHLRPGPCPCSLLPSSGARRFRGGHALDEGIQGRRRGRG